MRKMTVLIVIVISVAIVGGGAGALACGAWKVIGVHYEDDFSSAAAITEIHLTGGTVAATVRSWDGTGVEVHRTARYLNWFHERPAATYSISGSVLELRGDDSTMFSSIEYTVLVPAGYRVTADIGTGSVDATGASGADLNVSTGSIRVVDATGAVQAKTGTGAISVDLAAPENVDAKAGTGSVDVTVPSAAYRVEASSGMGEVKIGIPNDPYGAHTLKLRSDIGRVSVVPTL
jgi:Toastrack DUF4097